MFEKPIILSCEGNIGAGKSTILSNLQTYLEKHNEIRYRVLFMKEPVEQWEAIDDKETNENILQKFYADPRKYAFSFQIMAYATRMNMLKRLISENQKEDERLIIICERCLETDKHVFAKMLHDDGCIDEIHYQIYNIVSIENPFPIDGIIYLESDPEVCMRRINQRARTGENGISIDYLRKCHAYHESWFASSTTPILRLNVNQDVSYSESDSSDMGMTWLQHIIDFIPMNI
uniref:Deoxynucleoside kinase domain-containing protein n=1 Tax=viral metagenome TaxID=1070528 RepID=A0A6C0ASB7_9ZZZZ